MWRRWKGGAGGRIQRALPGGLKVRSPGISRELDANVSVSVSHASVCCGGAARVCRSVSLFASVHSSVKTVRRRRSKEEEEIRREV